MLSGANNFVVNDSTFVQNIVQNTTTGEGIIPIRDILSEWLSADNVQKSQRTLFSMCTKGTGRWFLNHPQFMHWIEHPGEVLWCPGFPGVGKTCIMSLAVHHLQNSAEVTASPVLFYYFDYKNELTTLENVFETLLGQLIGLRLQDDTKRILANLRARKNRPTAEDLIPVLENEIKSYQRCFILIDALDEFALDAVRSQLIDYVRKLVEELSVNAIIFSRDNIPEILEDMQWATDKRLDIVDHSEDIRLFIEKQIDGNRKIKWLLHDSPTRQEVVESVLSMSKGMFLTARLHMDAINNCVSKTDILETLKRLPPKLNEVYDAALLRIKEHDMELALKLFSWILHSRRPLTLLELQHVLAIHTGREIILDEDLYPEQYIKSIGVGLITFQSESNGSPVVGFVHYTAHHYFKSCERLPPLFELVRDCLTYLCMPSITETGDWSNNNDIISGYHTEFPALQYTSLHWGDHAELLPGAEIDLVTHLIVKLLLDSKRMKIIAVSNGLQTDLMFFMLVLHGWTGLLNLILSMKQSVTVHGKVILETTSLVDINARDDLNATALHYACAMGNLNIVELLLAQDGINPNVKEQQTGMTPLHLAVSSGKQGIEIFRWHHPDSVHLEEKHIEIVKLLLLHQYVDPNIPNNDGETVLHVAVRNRSEIILRLLLQRTDALTKAHGKSIIETANLVDVNATDCVNATALHYASAMGDLEFAEVLLAQDDIKPNIKEEITGMTPLHKAVSPRKQLLPRVDSVHIKPMHTEIVKLLLLRPDVDPNIQDKNGKTVLHLAIESHSEDILTLLLQRTDVSMNEPDNEKEVPLHLAALKAPALLEKICMRTDTDVNFKDRYGFTALHNLIISQNAEACKILLQRPDLNLNQVNRNGTSALHLAVVSGGIKVVNVLLQRSIHLIDFPDETGQTPLMVTVERENVELVKLVLSYRPKLGLVNEQGNSALHIAVIRQNAGVIDVLLATNECDPHRKNSSGDSPLDLALGGYYNVSVMATLISKGLLGSNSSDRSGLHVLFLAIKNRDTVNAKTLLNLPDIKIDAKNEYDQTPLHLAAMSGLTQIVSHLLELARQKSLNAYVMAEDNVGLLPIHCAAQAGHVSTVKKLIAFMDMERFAKERELKRSPLYLAYQAYHSNQMNIIKLLMPYYIFKPISLESDSAAYAQMLNEDHKSNDSLMDTIVKYSAEELMEQVDENGDTVIHQAIKYKFENVFNVLMIMDHIDFNITNNYGHSPLHVATNISHDYFVKTLIERSDVQPGIINEMGQSIFHIVAKTGDKDILDHILTRKEELNVNLQDNESSTPLHIAAQQGHLEFAKALYSAYNAEIDPNKFNAFGFTPLHLAVISEHTSFAEFLISLQRVDIKLPDQSEFGGYTPYEWAKNVGIDEITKLMSDRLQLEEKRANELDDRENQIIEE